MNKNLTLAIAPGKRELGVAVFSGVDLIYSSVKTIRNQKSVKNSLELLTMLLRKLFQKFSISTVVTKAVSQYQKLSNDLTGIVELIKFESLQQGKRIVEITIEQIKTGLCGENSKLTQKRAFQMLLAIYPELKKYWNRPNKWQNDYYAFLFSAVAVGTAYLKPLS